MKTIMSRVPRAGREEIAKRERAPRCAFPHIAKAIASMTVSMFEISERWCINPSGASRPAGGDL